MSYNPVRWFEIYVDDMERAKKFYEHVFNYKLTKLEGMNLDIWGFPMERDQEGCGGALVKMAGVTSGGCSTIVYFASEDCAQEETRIAHAGGRIHKSKTSIAPYGFIVLAFDTEENMFGIHSMT